MEQRTGHEDTGVTVETAKAACHIDKPNSEMTDDEIATVCKWIGQFAPDTMWADGKPVFGRIGIETMVFITLTEFPEFYERWGLSQWN